MNYARRSPVTGSVSSSSAPPSDEDCFYFYGAHTNIVSEIVFHLPDDGSW